MKVLDFKCPVCENMKEVFLMHNEIHPLYCTNHIIPLHMERIISAPHVVVKMENRADFKIGWKKQD